MSEAEKSKAQLVIVTGLVVFSFIFKSVASYLIIAAAVIGLLCVFIPVFGDLLVKGWYKLAEGLGWFNSRVLLGLIFFVFLWPISMLYRLFSKNPMGVKRPTTNSVYTERNHLYDKKDLEKIW